MHRSLQLWTLHADRRRRRENLKRYRIRETGIDYTKMPKPAKQDNKDTYIGGGGSNAVMIRFPKKARKTAWKRFYRLFPATEGCKTYNEYTQKRYGCN